MRKFGLLLAFAMWIGVVAANAQERVEPIAYGDMESWLTRKVHESGIIGGHEKVLMELGPKKEIVGNEAYTNQGGSPWENSNIMAKVAGIVKTNASVYPEQRGDGYCAKLETHIEKVKVLGIVNISVIASGSLFLGKVREPITSTKSGESSIDFGMPFTERPKAVQFDYKLKMADAPNRLKMNGFRKKSEVPGRDKAIMVCFLQKRTQDEEGNVIAKRVGTAAVMYDESCDWVNGARYEIMYGDITNDKRYVPELMALGVGGYHTRNSEDDTVMIKEDGWAEPGETPTHIILQFTSSFGGAFIGSPGNTMWVDNVCLVYDK